MAIQLIVGLGNPGPQYSDTRHNAGAWWVQDLSHAYGVKLQEQKKFYGLCARTLVQAKECWLLLPTTFMNHSGQAVRALAQFYKIEPQAILIAHDELDLPAGVARLKYGGGHGGHNGLRDIIAQLGTANFHRLRIGIGHPGERSEVLNHVLKVPAKAEREQINLALDRANQILPDFITGNEQKAMRELHG
jgi:PTH1 family peptidyl-tRNA hydrolase